MRFIPPNLRLIARLLFVALMLQSCSSARVLSESAGIKGVDLSPKKEALTDAQLQQWFMADPARDSVAGISLDRVKGQLKPKKTKPVVVAIVDSGVDLDHEGFSGKFWNNEDEIAANGIDDDNNGFIDDICIWSRALSAAEVFQLYQSQQQGFDPTLNYIEDVHTASDAVGAVFWNHYRNLRSA